jgi:hypothetical protein
VRRSDVDDVVVNEARAEGRKVVEIDVHGESHHQESLARIAGPKEPTAKSVNVGVTLRCKPTNEYDRNAVRVEAFGMFLGFIAKQPAQFLAPAMSATCGGVIEGLGVVVGGWDDGETSGSYGIRVWIDNALCDRMRLDPDLVRCPEYPEP